jgi:hypothetical protein
VSAAPGTSRWTTPRALRALLGASWVATALLFAVSLRALDADRAALRVLSQDTAPSIVTAQELGAQLADLDVQLAASLLGSAATRDVANELFELRRSTVTRCLVDAANNATLGNADRIPVVVMNEELGRYLELAARAQWLYAENAPDLALGLMRIATDQMHDRILPQAVALDRVKREQMDQRYDAAQRASRGYELEAIVTGALLMTVLVGAMAFVRTRMRRRLVPGLLLAAALAVLCTSQMVTRFRVAREDLRVARDDAFNSIHALWRARAVAFDARGDEERWLLDRARAGSYQTGFLLKTGQLLSGHAGTGLLADELHNVTFLGERDAAQAAVQALGDYLGADDRMRALERQGKHADALDAALGSRPDQAGPVFDRLDAALQRTTAINQDAFGRVMTIADAGLKRAEWLEPAFALAIVLAAWLGIRPRLKEYST